MTQDSKEKWRTYPVSLDDYKALVVDGKTYLERLNASRDLFKDRSNVLLLESNG